MANLDPSRPPTAWPVVALRGFRPDGPVAPQNELLTALWSHARTELRPYLKPVYLASRKVLFDDDEPLTRCFFPQGSTAVSMIRVFQDGRVSEMATVGSEGVVPGV